jgi:hypothetical protein
MSATNGKHQASDEKLLVFEANMDAALRAHYRRAKIEVVDEATPMSFDQFLKEHDDGISGGDGGVGEYEMRQRKEGAKAYQLWQLKRCGIDPNSQFKPGLISKIIMQTAAAGRACHIPFWASMSFTEVGLLFSQTKAAASFRSQLISGLIREAGNIGIRQPGQKSPLSIPKYSEVQKGNSNRARKMRPRQSSFLFKLKTNKESRKAGRPTRTGKSISSSASFKIA